MKNFTLIIGAVYGLLSVILGAFGAHALKKVLSVEKLQSFETGVKYQMYSALFLLIVGYILKFESPSEKWISILMIAGTFLFSMSIYFLSFSEVWNTNLKFLGPITPIGGLLMIDKNEADDKIIAVMKDDAVYGNIKADYFSADGKISSIGEANGVSVYTPNAKRYFEMKLQNTGNQDLRKGKLKIQYVSDSDISQEKMAEAEIILQN